MVLSKPLCLIRWESEGAGKATAMSGNALIVSATKTVASCLLLNTNRFKRFLFCCLCRKRWKGSLSVVSVAFLFLSILSLPQRFNSGFLLLSVTFKNCWSILAVHPIREERRGWERASRKGDTKRRTKEGKVKVSNKCFRNHTAKMGANWEHFTANVWPFSLLSCYCESVVFFSPCIHCNLYSSNKSNHVVLLT